MTFDQISLILTQINDYYYYRKKESFPFYIYNQLIEDLTRAPENNKNFHFIYSGGPSGSLEIKGKWTFGRRFLLGRLFGKKLTLRINGYYSSIPITKIRGIKLDEKKLSWFNKAFAVIISHTNNRHDPEYAKCCLFFNFDLAKYLVRGYQLIDKDDSYILYRQKIQFCLENYLLRIYSWNNYLMFEVIHNNFKVYEAIHKNKQVDVFDPHFQWDCVEKLI